MDVAPIRPQVQDRVTHDLAGTVVSDVAAAAGLVQFDVARRQDVGGGDQVRARRIDLDTQRDDVGMFEKEEQVRDAPGAALLDEAALHLARRGIRDDAEAADLQVTHILMVSRATD